MNIEASETTPRVLFLTSGCFSEWTIHALLIAPDAAVIADDIRAFNDTLDGEVPFVPVPGSEAKINRKAMNRRQRITERERAGAVHDRNTEAFDGPRLAKMSEYAEQYGIKWDPDGRGWSDGSEAKIIAHWMCENRGYQWADGTEAHTEWPRYRYPEGLLEEGENTTRAGGDPE